MVGKLAVSLAGHDKGSIFLVIREDGDVSGWQTESAVCISHPNGKKENTFSWF